jgi:hypothetical protein
MAYNGTVWRYESQYRLHHCAGMSNPNSFAALCSLAILPCSSTSHCCSTVKGLALW